MTRRRASYRVIKVPNGTWLQYTGSIPNGRPIVIDARYVES